MIPMIRRNDIDGDVHADIDVDVDVYRPGCVSRSWKSGILCEIIIGAYAHT